MAYIDSCIGCSASINVTSEDIKGMILNIINSGKFNLVSEEVYNKRIQKCGECKYLEYNTTCRQCGCIVQVRGLLKEKDCPHSKNSMWE